MDEKIKTQLDKVETGLTNMLNNLLGMEAE